MTDLGFNYRITDIQCALGRSQLKKLPGFLLRRATIANRYSNIFSKAKFVRPLDVSADINHAWHLYVVQVDFEQIGMDRNTVFKQLRDEGIGVNVHYLPVHLHPFYQNNFGTHSGICPHAESAYEELLSLPIHPSMTDADIDKVISVMMALCRN
jgi:perosamine synthetase